MYGFHNYTVLSALTLNNIVQFSLNKTAIKQQQQQQHNNNNNNNNNNGDNVLSVFHTYFSLLA